MNRVKLGDVCLSITDGEHGSPKNDPQGSCWFLNNNNLTDSGVVINSNDRRISAETFEQIRKRTHMEQGDVLISSCGTLGKTCIVQEDPTNFEFSRSVGIIKPRRSKLNAKYLHYFFMLQSTQKRIQKIATGGVQKHFYIADMEDFQIYLPDIFQQDAVASLLGAIDDKITLNKKLCTELEETAQLIYDYWFTQFDFPDENGNPYRSSGGKMVYNKTLKREIPEGWTAGNLSSISSYANETIANASPNMQFFVSTDNMLSNRRGVTPSQYVPSDGTSAHYLPGDILLSNIRPYFKKIWLADREGGCCNDVLVIRAVNDEWRSFLYQTIWGDTFFAHDSAGAKGSKMPRGDKLHIMSFPIALPTGGKALLRAFNHQTVPIQKSISKIHEENNQLTDLRSWLLPMLMNGQVKIVETSSDDREVHG